MNDTVEPKKEVKTEPIHPAAPPVVVDEAPRVAPPNAKWYVVHTYSGHENKVSANLRQRIETMKLADKIFDIVVPTRNIVTVKHGKKEEQKEKIFPGYILVKMVLDDASWLAVRTTQGVTAFVGAGNKPTPISEPEVATILKFMQM
jgi:transcriptional antiterminator NusG